MSKLIKFNVETLVSTCGVGLFYGFKEPEYNWGDTVDTVEQEAGCGWYVAGFVDNPTCKDFYEQLCAKFPVVYQSPVRINANSGQEFFFCVFDTGEVVMVEDDDNDF